MITRNWYTWFKTQRAKTTVAGALTSLSGAHTTSGYKTSVGSEMLFWVNSFTLGTNNDGVVLGRGTTPATLDDYMLEDQITEGLSASVASELDADNDTVLTLTVTNISAEDITIGEIGIVVAAPTGTNSGSTKVLIERTVLDSPVTIPAGGVAVVTYTIKLNIPEA